MVCMNSFQHEGIPETKQAKVQKLTILIIKSCRQDAEWAIYVNIFAEQRNKQIP